MIGKLVRRLVALVALSALLLGLAIAAEGRLSGWARLAAEYPGPEERGGLDLVVRRGGLGEPRWFHGVAPLDASMGLGGLQLRYPFPYSLGHSPLQIPWRALRVLDATLEGEDATVLLAVAGQAEARITLTGDVAAVVREWLAPARD